MVGARFGHSVRRGCAANAHLDPVPPAGFAQKVGEFLIVRIDSPKHFHYWLSNRRVLCDAGRELCEIWRYEEVCNAYWMFRESFERLKDLMKRVETGEDAERTLLEFRRQCDDPIELEMSTGHVMMSNLGDAWSATLGFLSRVAWWTKHERAVQ